MKILDKTPYRTESGEIDIVGRVRGSLSHGLSWYARLQAQNVVIGILEKVLNDKYVLARNVTLPDTEIELPLVLVGPQGVFLINVAHERGVYRAKDDEWGTVVGERFVPASINQVKRTLKLGRVLQVYLERAGFKDLVVEPILMSADPGTHIESVRPAVRIIMSDALERFAISMNQGSTVLSAEVIYGIVKTILTGPQEKKAESAPRATSAAVTPANGGRDTTDALFAGAQQQDSESLGFSYKDEPSAGQAPPRPTTQRQSAAPQNAEPQRAAFQNTGYQDRGFDDTGFQGLETGREGFSNADAPMFDDSQSNTPAFDTAQPDAQAEIENRPKALAPKKKGLFGMSTRQLVILGVILLCWLCSMAGFAAYLYFNLND